MAVMANVESREWRRRYCAQQNLPPEHPRASTTDDVECFFSVLRDSVGKDFTLKEVSDSPKTLYFRTSEYIGIGVGCPNLHTEVTFVQNISEVFFNLNTGVVRMEEGH